MGLKPGEPRRATPPSRVGARILSVVFLLQAPILMAFDGGINLVMLLMIILGGSTLVLIVLLVRTSRELRRRQLEPPVWLLPYMTGNQTGETPTPDSPSQAGWQAAVAEAAADQDRYANVSGRLSRQRRMLLVMLAVNFVLSWVVAGWNLYADGSTGPKSSKQAPALYPDSSPTARMVSRRQDRDSSPAPLATQAIPTSGGALDPKHPGPLGQNQLSALPGKGATGTLPAPPPRVQAPVAGTSTQAGQTQARIDQAAQDSILAAARQAVLDSIQRAAQAKAAEPQPAPAPAPPPPPPAPDPVIDRERASEALHAGGRQFVEAANAKRAAGLILPTEDAKRKAKFGKFLAESLEGASLGTVDGVNVLQDHSEATATITFRYRDDFGVEKKREVHVKVVAVRSAAMWRFEGVRLIEAFP